MQKIKFKKLKVMIQIYHDVKIEIVIKFFKKYSSNIVMDGTKENNDNIEDNNDHINNKSEVE